MTQDLNNSTITQRALNLHEVPPEKWQSMALRTVIGTVFFVLGLGLLGFMLYVFNETKNLSVILLGCGIASILVGTTTWSSQIIVNSLMALVNPVKMYKRIKDGRDDA